MSLREQAYHAIRHKIISLDMPPGATVDETTLQEELGMGRTPIRESLLRLSQERLVTIIPRRGMFVTDVGVADLRQIFEVRLVMEALAVRLAAQYGTRAHWAQMEQALSSLPEPGTEDEHEIMIGIDEKCHRIIYEASGNHFLEDMLSTLYAQSLRLWYLLLRDIASLRPAIMEHQAMLEAFQAGDEARAVALMEQHILSFQKEIQAAMLGQPTRHANGPV